MLIIFDLDDTLIDTSGAITPFKMKECMQILIEEGLPVLNFDRAYAELLQINQRSGRSQDALLQFAKSFRGDWTLSKRALDVLTSPLPEKFPIPTTPHAKEVLKFFRDSHILALVTGGRPSFQLEKLKKAGIEPSIFSKIAIPEDSVKKPFYEGLLKEFSVQSSQVVVCGDRIALDLVPARELGFTTVHMRWGRGATVKTEDWINYAISDLSELKGIVKT